MMDGGKHTHHACIAVGGGGQGEDFVGGVGRERRDEGPRTASNDQKTKCKDGWQDEVQQGTVITNDIGESEGVKS